MGCGCSSDSDVARQRRSSRGQSSVRRRDDARDLGGALEVPTAEMMEGYGEPIHLAAGADGDIAFHRCLRCSAIVPDFLIASHTRQCNQRRAQHGDRDGTGSSGRSSNGRTSAGEASDDELAQLFLLLTLLHMAATNGEQPSAGATGPPRLRGTLDSCSTTMVLTERSLPKPGSTNTNCTICLTEFAAGDEARILPCFHMYHRSCIDEWVKKAAVCPVCRENPEELAERSHHHAEAAPAAASPSRMEVLDDD